MYPKLEKFMYHVIAAAALFGGLSEIGVAATLTWPNPFGLPGAFCNTTLQACLDGAAAGDVVQIGADDSLFPDRYTTVDENLTINKSLTLRGVRGIDAVFTAGRGITINPPSVALVSYTIAVESVIFTRGTVAVTDQSLLTSIYRIEGVRFNNVSAGQCAISMSASFGPAPNFQVFRNVIRVLSDTTSMSSGVCLNSGAANWQASVAGNRIEALSGGMRHGIVASSNGAGPIRISANTIVGRGFQTGIEVQQSVSAARALVQVVNNSISGQDADPTQFAAGMFLLLFNADAQVINNSVVDGDRGLIIGSFASAPPVSGLLANNLVAFHRGEGLTIDTSVAAAFTNRNNLMFGNAINTIVPGPGTLATDPQLLSLTYPRPRDSSPAINNGSNSAIPALTLFDADGQPRTLLATVDIGAYEAGFALTGVHVANAFNIVDNQTDIGALDGTTLAPSTILVATSLQSAGAAAALAQNIGVWLPGGIGNPPLSIFHENAGINMPIGRRFAVTTPGFGLTGFTHATAPGNISAQYTTLSNSALDSRPGAIAVATHNYLASGPYHDFAIGLEYIGTRWNLRNEDFSVDMPSTRYFNVVVAPQITENAFRVFAPTTPVVEMPITHPLLDDNACAAPIVGRVGPAGLPTVFNSVPFSVDYRAGFSGSPGRWFIVAQNGLSPTAVSFPADAAFNVIIDGAQANGCRAPLVDLLFKNSFE